MAAVKGAARTLRSYHFSGGNSTTGPVGFCAQVRAYTKEEAADILASALPQEYETSIHENDERVEYLTFYLNSNAIKKRLIDAFENVAMCDECGDPLPEEGAIGCPDGAEICQSCFDAGAH